MMGAGLGVALGHLFPGTDPALWPLVCMAATLGGTMRAPLTASVFAFGLTHDANALLPLLATSAAAYGFTVLTMKRSILTEKIARRGYHIYREYGIDPLERHFVEEVMSRSTIAVEASLPAAQVMQDFFGAHQIHRAFPVVERGRLVGIVDRATVSAWAAASGERPIGQLCADPPPQVAVPGETCRSVATRLARHRLERRPVVREADSMELVGIIARSDLIKPSLINFEEEEQRERMLGLPWQAGP
jgi:CBS domain-containing protein